MNKTQEKQLGILANGLSIAVKNNNPQSLSITHKRIRNAVEGIYKSKVDVQSVLKVEQILNGGYANVAGSSIDKKERMQELAEKAEIGLEAHKTFSRIPKDYVQLIDLGNKGIGKSKGEGRRFVDGVPIEPVRAAFMQFRNELREYLKQADQPSNRTDLPPDQIATARTRFDATITGERLFIKEYLSNRHNEREEKKQEHLQNFDKRMTEIIRRMEPKQQRSPNLNLARHDWD